MPTPAPLTAAEILALSREQMEKVNTLRVMIDGKFQLEDTTFPFKLDGEMDVPDRAHGIFEVAGEQIGFARLGDTDYVAKEGVFEFDYANESGAVLLVLMNPFLASGADESFTELERQPDELLDQQELYHLTFRMDMLAFIEHLAGAEIIGAEISGRGELFIHAESLLVHRFIVDCKRCLVPVGSVVDLLVDFTLSGFDEPVVFPSETEQLSLLPRRSETHRNELNNIQSAVFALMVDNRLSNLTNPVTVVTNDMTDFPDTSAAGGAGKMVDVNGNTFTAVTDSDGWPLFGADVIGNAADAAADRINYTSIATTRCFYTVDAEGTVTQESCPSGDE